MKFLYLATALTLAPVTASALVVTNTNDAAALAAATLAAGSGITIQAGTESLIGGDVQQGTYTDFNFPGGGGEPALSMPDGVVLTSGLGTFSTTTNTTNAASTSTGTGPYAPLVTLASENGLNTTQNDSNVLSFQFVLDDPTDNAVEATFLFATDEFPTQSVTDIMGVFVNGVNYAFFPNGDLVSNQSGDPNDFFNNNAVGTDNYGIEWNGLTDVFTLTALANGGGAVNTIDIAIADTSDTIYDSAMFFSDLTSGTTSGGCTGIGCTGGEIPVPAIAWLLMAGLGGLGLARKLAKT